MNLVHRDEAGSTFYNFGVPAVTELHEFGELAFFGQEEDEVFCDGCRSCVYLHGLFPGDQNIGSSQGHARGNRSRGTSSRPISDFRGEWSRTADILWSDPEPVIHSRTEAQYCLRVLFFFK